MDEKTLLHLSHLARIQLTSSELSTFAKQFQGILSHIGRLKQVNTSQVLPTFQTTCPKTNFIKRSRHHLAHTLAVSTFKKNYQGFLVVPPSIEK